MKTTIRAKVVVETDKYAGFSFDGDMTKEELTLAKIRNEIKQGHYILEWINSEFAHEQEPTLIIKI